jgi:thiol-disulfide isomerase/thioredoxin
MYIFGNMIIKPKALVALLIVCGLFAGSVNAQTKPINKIHYITDTTLSFNGLINKFKNKIIYVDVWASWCGPCKQELQQRKSVKAFQVFAEKNGIVTIYICVDKDASKWKPFITKNNLLGYHILTNSNIYKDFHTDLSEVQNRNGIMKRSFYIPRHFIINKDGAVVYSMADSQGTPKVYAELKKLIGNTAN